MIVVALALLAALPPQELELSGSGPRFTAAPEPGAHAALDLDGLYDHAGRVELSAPPEGLWSIGVGWEGDWPREWAHGNPREVAREGEWLVARGEVVTDAGAWEVRDAWRRTHWGMVEGVRRWTWRGEAPSPPTVLSVRWLAPGRGPGVVLPGILYHGNPSGRRSREAGWPGLVATWDGAVGERAFFEEHRFPAPFASLEWPDETIPEYGRVAALLSHPSPAPFAARDDLWWSLGVWAREEGTELALLSGPVVLNGEAGVVKSGQREATPFPDAHLVVPPGGVVEKRYVLLGRPIHRQGGGFQEALGLALQVFGPFGSGGMPTLEETLRAKLRFALSRWRGDNPQPGFAMYPHERDLYVMGWAGQSEAPGYALQVLAERLADDKTSADELRDIARGTLDALCEAPFDENGFRLALDGRTGEWSRQDPVSQGQAMSSFARAIRVGRKQGADTARWEAFLRRACALHAERILADDWRPRSTAEAFLVQPLCLGAELFDEPRFLEAARKAGEHYRARHLSMTEPYWGGTLDARCEDKEGAWAALEAFLALQRAMDRPGGWFPAAHEWLQAARHAADVALTYTYLWDVDLPAGRLRDMGLRTRGWTSVSVQNMHLDVFGVVYVPELWRLSELVVDRRRRELAELMLRACGQGLDPAGSQGEQLQQTRFAQGGDLSDPERFRGGYVEGWTVFWITAHFLTAAAKLEEMGELGRLWRRR
jgi:hypothetical protein